ncbi:MAG: RHS repeat protein, partial [Actinomycetia bacterium]|nr:RHS repeat protein [Actinomycetes bacterium]
MDQRVGSIKRRTDPEVDPTADYSDGVDTYTVTYGYDAAGRRTSATGPDGTTTWVYDSRGRITQVTEPDGDV